MTVPYPAPVEAQMQRYYPSLSEKDCRRYAAIEAVKLGYGGQAYIRRRLGCHHATLALGLAELNDTATLTVTERHGERGIATLTTPEGTRTLDAALVVAADGKQSPLRRQANIDAFGWQYWQSCITTVLEPEGDHQSTAYERFWPSGPFAILPLPGGRCQVVWTSPHEEAQAILNLPEAEFMAELERRYGSQMGKLKRLTPPALFPVQLMQCDRYIQHRLALVGDAAHSCHPVGGQGLNMGRRDAAALAEVLTAAHQNGEDLGSIAVLRRYERWRRWENWVILSFTDTLTRSFSNQIAPIVARAISF